MKVRCREETVETMGSKRLIFNDTNTDGTVEKSTLTYGIVDILRSKPVQKIDFLFNAIIVSPSRFETIANYIEEFWILVFHDTKLVKAPDKESAYYYAGKNLLSSTYVENAFYFGFDSLKSKFNKSLVVHEAVHAILDVWVCNGVTELDSEAAAYTAQALYARAAGMKNDRFQADDPNVDAIYDAAFNVADDVLWKTINRFNTETALKEALLNVSVYAGADKRVFKSLGVRRSFFTRKQRAEMYKKKKR